MLAGAFGAHGQEQKGSAHILTFPATSEDVGRRLQEKAATIAAEPPVEGLSRRLSHYLRTRSPDLSLVTRDEAGEANLRFATSELGQPSPVVCSGDFDGNGLEDTALVTRYRKTNRLEVLAFHQIRVIANPGDHRGRDYRAYKVARAGQAVPGAKLDGLVIICQQPGRFESVEGGVTLILKNRSIYFGFSVYYFDGAEYKSLVIAD
jgi:hypothetical protein